MNHLKTQKHLYLATLLDAHFASHTKVEVVFVKVSDGSLRTMQCTTDADLISTLAKDAKTKKELDKKQDGLAGLVCKRVFDLEKNEFRAFNYDTIQTVDGLSLEELYKQHVE